MTKEECIRLFESRIANLTGMLTPLPEQQTNQNDSVIFDIGEISHIHPKNDEDDVNSAMSHDKERVVSFDFKVPEVPSLRFPTYKRQSLRTQQNEQQSIASMDRRCSVQFETSADQSTVEAVSGAVSRRRSVRIQEIAEQSTIDDVTTVRERSIQVEETTDRSTIDKVPIEKRRSVRNQEVAEQSIFDTVPSDRRRSVRIQQITEKRKSVAQKLPSPPEPKRRRITISKRSRRESTIGMDIFLFKFCPY